MFIVDIVLCLGHIRRGYGFGAGRASWVQAQSPFTSNQKSVQGALELPGVHAELVGVQTTDSGIPGIPGLQHASWILGTRELGMLACMYLQRQLAGPAATA